MAEDILDLIKDRLVLPTEPDRNGVIWSYCPAHDDGRRDGRRSGKYTRGSRSLKYEPGRPLKCFAGCSFREILEAFGVLDQWKQRNVSKPRHGDVPWPNMKLVSEYIYTSNGEKVVVKGRFESINDGIKTFRWRPYNSEHWKGINVGLEELDLYLANSIEERKSEPVWFVEGEKAAHACRNAGLLATCAATGASPSPRIGKRALEALRGRDVVLWPDNDEAGRRYMAAVRSMLDGVAKSVAVVAPPLPVGGDAYDWFVVLGKTKEELEVTPTEPWVQANGLDSITYYVPLSDDVIKFECDNIVRSGDDLHSVIAISYKGKTYNHRMNFLSVSTRQTVARDIRDYFGDDIKWQRHLTDLANILSEYLKNTSPVVDIASVDIARTSEFLIDGVLPDGECSMFFGEGDSGKTYIALYIAVVTAMGLPFLGSPYQVPQMPVLWIDYETRPDGSSVKYRLNRICEGLGVSLNERMVFYLPGKGTPVIEMCDTIERTIRTEGIGLIVVDSALKAVGGHVRDEISVGQYFAAMQRLNVTSLTIGHMSKADISEGNAEMPLGSVFWFNEPHGYIWHVARQNRNKVSSEQLVKLTNRKANDGMKPYPLDIEMRFVENGGPVTFSAK